MRTRNVNDLSILSESSKRMKFIGNTYLLICMKNGTWEVLLNSTVLQVDLIWRWELVHSLKKKNISSILYELRQYEALIVVSYNFSILKDKDVDTTTGHICDFAISYQILNTVFVSNSIIITFFVKHEVWLHFFQL